MQDYVLIRCGSVFFKIFRLLAIALLLVHIFACIYWKAKTSSSTFEDVEEFLVARDIAPDVSEDFSLIIP